MSITPHDTYALRIEELINRAEAALKTLDNRPLGNPIYGDGVGYFDWTKFKIEMHSIIESTVSILYNIWPNQSRVADTIAKLHKGDFDDRLTYAAGILNTLKDEIRLGLITRLEQQAENIVSADLLNQAEYLITDSDIAHEMRVRFAVFITGVILEKGIRSLCVKSLENYSLDDERGKRKRLNRMIADLKAENVIPTLMLNRLLAWAEMRNQVAHGEDIQLTVQLAQEMIQGINGFLDQYLG